MPRLRQPHLLFKIAPWVLLLATIVAFAGQCYSLRFVQDDAYITYRYARNVVRGHGPVYNPGERVEGYTNFLWMVLLAFLGGAGVPFSAIIPISQVLGVLSGIGVIIVFFLLLRRFSTGPPPLTPLALCLFAANGTFAYWCVSGMETGLFSLLLAAGFYVYLRDDSTRNRVGASILLGLSALTRPEGALFFGIVFLHHVVRRLYEHRWHRSDAPWAQSPRVHMGELAALLVPFGALVAPFYVWRSAYYGHLLPNTFYAKAGLDASSLRAGVGYLADFLRGYGFWGLALVVPAGVGLWRRRSASAPLLRLSLFVLAVHFAYVVFVGGDVLRMYRFFVPVYFLLYFALSESLWLLPFPKLFAPAALVIAAFFTFWGPFSPGKTELLELRADRHAERQLVRVLGATGSWLNANTGPDDWIACTTIGAIGYFSDRNLVDMLGLTDAVVAREPETIMGAGAYWKERRYNTRHVLERAPTYICFSTGDKPSAAAERALYLRARFRRGYYAYPFSTTSGSRVLPYLLFKAKPGVDTVPVEGAAVDVEFVDRYNAGINFVWASEYDSAVAAFQQCSELSPPDFPYGFERLGRTYLKMGRYDSARLYLQRALATDDWCVSSHLALGRVLARCGSHDSAVNELRAAVAYAPDYISGYTALADVLAQARQFGKAESILIACMGRFPEAIDPALRLARVRLMSGDSAAAYRDVTRMLDRYPDDRKARALLDSLDRRSGMSAGPDG